MKEYVVVLRIVKKGDVQEEAWEFDDLNEAIEYAEKLNIRIANGDNHICVFVACTEDYESGNYDYLWKGEEDF